MKVGKLHGGRRLILIYSLGFAFFCGIETSTLPCEWTGGPGKLTPYISGERRIESTVSSEECRERCINQLSFICAAVNYGGGNCELLAENNQTGYITPQDGWEYFLRPICAESSTAKTSAEIKYQGIIGNLPHLFTDIRVPVSGYLVAWQYYLNTVDSGSCPNNATIWRQVGPTDYKLISSTTLLPEDTLSDGVRFQFLQNQSVRVKKNDILAVIGKLVDGCSRSSLVSIDPKKGRANATITILESKKDYVVGEKFPYSFGTPRKATPALRAYISEYLSLIGQPTAFYNESLHHGQVFIKLPPPLMTEESVVVAGYRIICSIDANMSHTVPCYNNLVPVISELVLLTLPNTTRTYHAAVQIARNFNGKEELEDKLSDASVAFCTGRNNAENANITESPVESDDSNSQVNVTLIYSFQDDDCAKGIKLNYSSYDSKYEGLTSDVYEFFLKLERGQTYDLTIYLLLTDGGEVILWKTQYTTQSGASNSTMLDIHQTAENGENLSQPTVTPVSTEPTYENSTRILVDQLYERVHEEKRNSPNHPFRDEFKTLGNPQLPHGEGRTHENAKKNRFKNITAFNTTRVKLNVSDTHPSDYVNASYIKDYQGRKKFIAAQGPFDATIVDMWRTIQTTKATVIVMLTNLIENGKNKCSRYWPESGSTKFGDFLVTLIETTQFSSYVVRKMKYAIGNVIGTVTLCHYTEWYDHDVPSPVGLLSFRARVKQESAASAAPIIVHCSAGVGRTGTYIALEILIQEANDSKRAAKSIDVFTCVNNLRSQRMCMVQVVEQYAFLYDMVSEALSCGNTSVPCANFPATFQKWQQKGAGGVSVLSEQLTRLGQTSRSCDDGVCCSASQKENITKNRNTKALPSDRQRVLFIHSDDYINATFSNGYQKKRGFILTQIPMSSTTPEYWRMVVEQKSALVIYLNDCTEESPYLPQKDQSVRVGEIIVTTLHMSSVESSTSKAERESIIETVIECQRDSEVHRVKVLEIKTSKNRLPSCQQLVQLCQKAEKYATSGSDTITVQCRNGCRLSGHFLISMNLYMRMRIEQEVDIVLEVKLARNSRAQICTTLEELEALYKFVEYYLSEFNTYSNFSAID
ncbi:receptor-type tyrosine-protein phosphatase alpha-like [Watersipora subatra]|uniref:receptor-type tyrosine-protein phosphatase alpha-like n=1 Tax=Watersipora subatra TaxID=2589382 RepID=UPI00355B02F6